jgi:hypothetical protein
MLPYSITVDGVTLDFTSFAKLEKSSVFGKLRNFFILESLVNLLFWLV